MRGKDFLTKGKTNWMKMLKRRLINFRFFSGLFLLAACLTIASTTACAEPAVVQCSVSRRQQEKSNWCWEASSQMIGNYHS